MPASQQQKAKAADRRAQAFELRKAGATYRQIARQLGISHEMARKGCERVLADLRQHTLESAEQWRTLHMERLEHALTRVWPAVGQGDHQAIADMLSIIKREADLLGLDAPRKQEVTGADGGPLQIEADVNLTLTDDQRRERIAYLFESNPASIARSLPAPEPDMDAAERAAG